MDNKIFSVKHSEIPQVFSSQNNQCLICGKGFAYTSSLIKHMRIHTGEKPYCCRKGCDQRFSQISNLIRHERIHSGDKPYVCELCGKSFTSSSNLKQHLNIHQNNVVRKKFVCFIESCDKGYLYICTLKKHVKKTHPEEFDTILLHYQNDNFYNIFKHLMGNPKTFGFLNFKIDDKFELDNNECLSKPRLVRRRHKLKLVKNESNDIDVHLSTDNSIPIHKGFLRNPCSNEEKSPSSQEQIFSLSQITNTEQKTLENNSALVQFFNNFNKNFFLNFNHSQMLENLISSGNLPNINLQQILSSINANNLIGPNQNIFELIYLVNYLSYQGVHKVDQINNHVNLLPNLNQQQSVVSPEVLFKGHHNEDKQIVDARLLQQLDSSNEQQDYLHNFSQNNCNFYGNEQIYAPTINSHSQTQKYFLNYNNNVEEIVRAREKQQDLKATKRDDFI